MQPGMAGLFRAERQQLVVGVFAATAAEAPAWRRLNQLPVEPFGNAAGEGASLGFFTRQPAIELGDGRLVLEERVPVLSRPAAGAGSQQRQHLCLVPAERGND